MPRHSEGQASQTKGWRDLAERCDNGDRTSHQIVLPRDQLSLLLHGHGRERLIWGPPTAPLLRCVGA
jgi:hypothetical protein